LAPRPIEPHFPYTTLFRSRGVGDDNSAATDFLLLDALDKDAVMQRTDLHERLSSSFGSGVPCYATCRRARIDYTWRSTEHHFRKDRKSTRLNSSHQINSYA